LRLLLDTHVLLALLDERYDRLPPAHKTVVQDRSLEVLVSAATLWEIAIKSRLGRLPLAGTLADLPGEVTALGAALLNVTVHHVLHEVEPCPETKDPFDRLLLATADLERARLLTVDDKLVDHPLAWRAPAA